MPKFWQLSIFPMFSRIIKITVYKRHHLIHIKGAEWVMNSIELLIIASFATYLFYIFENIKSFENIYANLSVENCKKEAIIKNLLRDLNKHTNIEFAIYNSKMGKWLYRLLFFCVSFAFFSLVSTKPELALLLPSICVFYPRLFILCLGVLNKINAVFVLREGLYKKNLYKPYIVKKLLQKINKDIIFKKLHNIITEVFVNLVTYFKFILYIIIAPFLFVIILVIIRMLFDSSCPSVNWAINTTIFQAGNPLEMISGNKLSFSGILFTFGVGSSVIFSFVSFYNKRKEIFNEKITDIKGEYQKWFDLNKHNLNFDTKKYDEFDIAVDELKKNLTTFVDMNLYTQIYDSALLLSVIFCIFGIYVPIGTEFFIKIIFNIFLALVILFIVYMFTIFKYYDIPQLYETSITKSEDSLEDQDVHEFEDIVQSNYNEATSDNKQK